MPFKITTVVGGASLLERMLPRIALRLFVALLLACLVAVTREMAQESLIALTALSVVLLYEDFLRCNVEMERDVLKEHLALALARAKQADKLLEEWKKKLLEETLP